MSNKPKTTMPYHIWALLKKNEARLERYGIRPPRKRECKQCGTVELMQRSKLCRECRRKQAVERQRYRRHLASGLTKIVEHRGIVLSVGAVVKCKHCRTKFKPKRTTAKFCCAKCRVYWHREKQSSN